MLDAHLTKMRSAELQELTPFRKSRHEGFARQKAAIASAERLSGTMPPREGFPPEMPSLDPALAVDFAAGSTAVDLLPSLES